MLREKVIVTTPKKDDVAVNMVLVIIILENVVFKEKDLLRIRT
jgi:hypothetical protein